MRAAQNPKMVYRFPACYSISSVTKLESQFFFGSHSGFQRLLDILYLVAFCHLGTKEYWTERHVLNWLIEQFSFAFQILPTRTVGSFYWWVCKTFEVKNFFSKMKSSKKLK